MSEEPKPCPYCGENNAIICKTEFAAENRLSFAVSCRTKGCAGAVYSLAFGLFETEEQAIAAWNTRTPPEQNCKSFCKLFASAKTRDEFFAEKCRICKEGRTEDKWASFHERRNK
jgi:Lar family restriction alleviation protein